MWQFLEKSGFEDTGIVQDETFFLAELKNGVSGFHNWVGI